VWLGSELFATLSFSGPLDGTPRVFSHSDQELIELMARSVGRVVLEHRIQSERDRLQSLERNRNRVLEMVAENESISTILEEVVYLVEAQCPGALCSLLLLKDEMLTWATAPGFPADGLRLLKPFRVLRDTAGLAVAEVARETVFWDDVRSGRTARTWPRNSASRAADPRRFRRRTGCCSGCWRCTTRPGS